MTCEATQYASLLSANSLKSQFPAGRNRRVLTEMCHMLAGPFQSVFVPPSMWRRQDGWDLRAALLSAGLSADRSSIDWGRRFSFSDSPELSPLKAPIVRAY